MQGWSPTLVGMTVRDDAHRLLDEMPEEQLAEALDALQRVQAASVKPPRRRFRTTATFDGDQDLGARAKEIAREGWNKSA